MRLATGGLSILLCLGIALGTFAEIQPPACRPRQAKADVKPPPPEPKPPDAKPAEPKPQEPPARKPVTSLILTVKLALVAAPHTFPYEIEVTADGAEIVLSGEVATEEESREAAAVARQVEGVKSVVNQLKVVPKLAQALAHKRDEMITQYVKARFKASTTLDAADFEVKTQDGVVSLSGRTRFQVLLFEAAEAARLVPGVKAVRTDGVRLEPGD